MKNIVSIVFCSLLVAFGFASMYSLEKTAKETNAEMEKLEQVSNQLKYESAQFDSYMQCLQNQARSGEDYLCVKPKHIIDYEREHPEVIKEAIASVKPVIKPKSQVKKAPVAKKTKVAKKTTKPAKKVVAKAKPAVKKSVAKKAPVKVVKFDKKEAQKEVLNSLVDIEGFRAKAYRDGCLVSVPKGAKCPRGKERYSNGYGTLAKSKNESITKQEALVRKSQHLEKNCYKFIPDSVHTKSDYVLLSEICYNAGLTTMKSVMNIDGSVNYDKYQNVIYSNGKVNAGLEARRKTFMIYALVNQ